MDIVGRSKVDLQNLGWYAAKLAERDAEITRLQADNERLRATLQAMSEAVFEQPVGVWFPAINAALAPQR